MSEAPGQLLSRPIFIIGVHRSGTSLLYRLLMAAPGLFSIRTEGRYLFWKRHHPSHKEWESEVLTADDALPDDAAVLAAEFYNLAVPNASILVAAAHAGHEGDEAAWREELNAYIKTRNKLFRTLHNLQIDETDPREQALAAIKEAWRPLRFLEKTPSNILHVGFLNELFPDALFVYIKRDGRGNVNSLMEAWRLEHQRFGFELPLPVAIPGVLDNRWRAILPPGWQEYVDRPLEEVAAFQWMESNRIAMDDLARIAPERVHSLFYEDLVQDTPGQVRALCAFIGVPFEGHVVEVAAEPPVAAAITPPEQDKWKRQNGALIERMVPLMAPVLRQMGYDVPA